MNTFCCLQLGSDFLGYRKHLKFVYFMKSENFWSSNLLLLIVITQ